MDSKDTITLTKKELKALIAEGVIETLNMLLNTRQLDLDEVKVSTYDTNIPGMGQHVLTSVDVSSPQLRARFYNGFHLR